MKIVISILISITILGCNPKQNKEIVKEEIPAKEITEEIIVQKPSKLIFCQKLFERTDKLTFINNIYMAFQSKDSSLIKPYITTPVSLSIENSISGGFSSKTISNSVLNNWSGFLNEIAPTYGTSVCTKVESRAIELATKSCLNDSNIENNTAYLKYIHYEKIKGQYVLKAIGMSYKG